MHSSLSRDFFVFSRKFLEKAHASRQLNAECQGPAWARPAACGFPNSGAFGKILRLLNRAMSSRFHFSAFVVVCFEEEKDTRRPQVKGLKFKGFRKDLQ